MRSSGGGHRAHVHADLTNVFNLVMGCRIQLDDVEGVPGRDTHTGVAYVAGLPVLLEVRAVDRLGEEPGARRLSRAPRPREQVGVGDLAVDYFSAECLGDVILADDLVETLRPILAVERLILHRRRWYSR